MGLVDFLENRRKKKIIETLERSPEKQRVSTVLNCFDMEVMNGGLCQFFVNESRYYAPYVSESLEIIGAKDVNEAFLDFVTKNKIDLRDLSSFKSATLEEFSAQYKRYPFDDFDKVYYSQPEESSVSYLVKKYLEH